MSDNEPVNPAPNGADPAAAKPNGDSRPDGQSELEARIKSDPSYAWEQYNKVKGEGTKTFQQLQKYKPIQNWAEQYGAESVAKWVSEYDAILKHPEVQRVANHYRTTGALPTADANQTKTTEFDDLYKDPQAEKLQQLEGLVSQLSSQVSQTRGAVGKQRVMGMLVQLKTDVPDGFDEYILPALRDQFERWERDPSGRELLANIDYEGLKTIAGKAIFENRDKIFEERHTRMVAELRRGATGAPASNLSTGREPKATAAKPGHMSAVEALREFERTSGERLGR